MAIDKDTVLHDPNFYFPPEFTEMEASERAAAAPADDTLEGQPDDESDLGMWDDYSNSIETPNSIRVVSQTVRTGPDGSQVVDVVIEVEDIADAVQCDVRVTVA